MAGQDDSGQGPGALPDIRVPALPTFAGLAAGLAEYDLSGFESMSLEALMKEVQVNVRLPQPLYQAVKDAAARQSVPYTCFARSAIVLAVMAKS